MRSLRFPDFPAVPVLNHVPGDGRAARQLDLTRRDGTGKVLAREPARRRNLLMVDGDLCGSSVGPEAQHD